MPMEQFNPYEVLGVPRDAGAVVVKAAYRNACKTCHPDAGGDPDDFRRLQRAFDILSDPERRKRYDATGDVSEEAPDNDRAAALQVIDQKMAEIMSAFIGGGMKDPLLDPRRFDVPARIREKIDAEIRGGLDAVPVANRVIALMKDMRARFSSSLPADHDPILRIFEMQIRQNELNLANLQQSLRVHRLAVMIAADYRFAMDDPYLWPGNTDFDHDTPADGDRRRGHSGPDGKQRRFMR